MKTNNQFADEFLLRFQDSKTIVVKVYDDKTRIGWNVNLNRGLIIHNKGYSQEFTITPLGIKVLKAGGWENYIDNEVQAEKLKEHENKLALKKLRSDLNLVENKLAYYGITQLIVVVSFIISVVLAILKITE